MADLFSNARHFAGFWTLVGAVAALYVAARTAFDTTARFATTSAAGRLGFVQWAPIALVALVAAAMRQPAIAVGVIFATSVASLSLVFGLTALLSPTDLASAPGRRAWPFVLPAAIIILLAGFSAQFAWWHGLFLLAQGVVVVLVWREIDRADPPAIERASLKRSMPLGAVIVLFLTFVLAAIGAWAAVTGTILTSREIRVFSPALIATIVLSPALVLPMIGSGSAMAHRGQTAILLSTHVAVVLLNLLLLLPLTIGCWYAAQMVQQSFPPAPVATTMATTTATTTSGTEPSASADDDLRALPFPMGTWRVDTVVLIVLGFVLIPIAAGRWPVGRAEGLVLVLAYMAYLIAATRIIAPRL